MRRLLLALAALLACGPSRQPPSDTVPEFRGLLAEPRQLAFTCVAPGCDTTLMVKVYSNVNRRVAVKRVVLSDSDHPEFTVTASEAPPFILGAAGEFMVSVQYAPTRSPDSGALAVLITYTDALGEESPDRIDPGELSVPLVRRLVGEPVLVVSPTKLSFGTVAPGARKTLPLQVRNEGSGNLTMDIDVADAGHPDLHLEFPTERSLRPDAGTEMKVTFAPSMEEYVRTDVQIGSTSPGVRAVAVSVEGTSLSSAAVALEPEERTLDFGSVPRGQTRTATLKIANRGGQPLTIQDVGATDPAGNLVATCGGLPRTIQPLERIPLQVTLDGATAGPVAGTVNVQSDDLVRPTVSLSVTGLVTEPQVLLTPTSIDFGDVPSGWVLTKPIEIRNVGWGPLVVKRVMMVGGSSTLFALQSLPQLPLSLDRNQRVAVEVEFRSETSAGFGGSVSVESDDPVSPFAEVTLAANGTTCAAGCPIANGTPSCTNGKCSVGSCNPGYHDTDKLASTGCECKEIGTDPGELCGTAADMGILRDKDHASKSHTGIISSEADVDWIRFYAEDGSDIFSESWQVRIRLSSADSNIQWCIYRYETGNHVMGCFLNNEMCSISRYYYRDGSLGSGDSSEYYIKVFRGSGAPATCTSYTLYMSNG